ncbi:hypothetical protein EOA13_02625 [Mesorhizobium sp. M7A.F.Ca.US.011.01.1.1]|uniref:hypothetical protein n=1 Tax=Mesorhizobium sp. M7A.F.Ca.US.011.01.1.1 TaxID=2496741 RepID=UPI000FCA9024|nr:hypothetical protein [Mesorhizobium sp. M7A.F.Ca.US.011.01.1.1]RUX31898.1 hypothetical protein EOA13_02625 [Mesorhizobium sp. M7A.F.Ca.US.011.01.1.1]
MRIIIRDGEFSYENDLQPAGQELWAGGADDLPAAVLASMSNEFEPGTWYAMDDFVRIVGIMKPVSGQDEVLSTVLAEQHGVDGTWQAWMEIGQSQAALMVCKSVCDHAVRRRKAGLRWIRVD